MTEAEIYSGFSGNWLKSANEYYVSEEAAPDFVGYLLKNNIRILGIEGFYLTSEVTQPELEKIADFSVAQPSKEVLLSFLKSIPNNVTHYNFVLDI